ncbi:MULTISPECIES: hypothetical protein [unclassified Clostridioides]|uniref:hypothetical protein n=1 Tax=unclassified Clostridioides TaxID=2635829 RepID=UPI001D0FD29C|nr:hypothetical protein [Clostridioides sp. ES-S-0171-01]MCC0687933.1 hypothetical protein [Clostridioides sp. ES-S-0056-01]MCC0714585.1 hypothetical protein [Clostridioides sp. ES-S-0077-01]UDN53423.1 hypothetical protein JJC02_10950 [Clostridioides sp. ES-S-0054-01]
MLLIEDIMNIKEKTGYKKLIHIKFGTHEYIFKLINLNTYIKANLVFDTYEEFNDFICQSALIYPKEFVFSKSPIAGLTDEISKRIIHESHILDESSIIDYFEESRSKLNTFLEQSKLFVKAAFPEISLKEIRDWDYEKLMEMTAKSEYILKLRGVDVNLEYDKDYLNNKSNKEYINSNNNIKSKDYHLDSNNLTNTRWDRPEKLKVLENKNIQKLNMETERISWDFIKIGNKNDKDNVINSRDINDKNRNSTKNKDDIINSNNIRNSKISNFRINENLKDYNNNISKIHLEIRSILNRAGYKNIDINYILGGKDSNIDLNFYENRLEKFKMKMLKMIGDIIDE